MKLKILPKVSSEFSEILTPGALDFIQCLNFEHNNRRLDLLNERSMRQAFINNGVKPGWISHPQNVRNTEWSISPIPKDLLDRRVEITGPTDRKMVINALNSGASVFMADFEDSNSPTWSNMVQGQINLKDAVNKTISLQAKGKEYKLNDHIATLFVRSRGLHLQENNILIDGMPISASLFDFGLFFYHNARTLLENGSGPYFYLPKLQNHLEARWWNDVFDHAQDMMSIPRGTIKATMLIEHILAAFETEEMLYELRNHSAGLNCGRWDYIFSYIKTFRNRPEYVLPDRSLVTMTVPFMNSYCKEVIRACHKRGAHAMGGMAAQIPIKDNPEANDKAFEKVKADKDREYELFCDGTWVAHPGLINPAMQAFSKMTGPNQIHKQRNDAVSSNDLISNFSGPITDDGVKLNVDVGIQYLESWLQGNGCVPIYNLMEDMATCEISRTQIWQWIRHRQKTTSGRSIDSSYIREIISDIELSKKESPLFQEASEMFYNMSVNEILSEFLSLHAYDLLLTK